jgi:hypothetical protein
VVGTASLRRASPLPPPIHPPRGADAYLALTEYGLMSGESRTCATGSRAGMTISPFVSSRTLPTMKFRMTYDRYTRHEADSFFQEPSEQVCRYRLHRGPRPYVQI